PHKESCDGELTKVVPPTATEPGLMEFEGTGTATHMGKYHIVGGHFFTPEGDLVGSFTSTASDGSTIAGTYQGVFFEVGPGLIQLEASVEYGGGPGRRAGVTGQADTVALLDAPTGDSHYDTLGTWTLP